MAESKVTKQLITSNKIILPRLFKTLFLYIVQPIVLVSLFLLSDHLFAEEQTDYNFQFTGVVQINGTLIYPQEHDLGFDASNKGNTFYSDDESLRLISSGDLNSSANWEIQYLNQRLATNFPSGLISRSTNSFRIRNSRHYFVEDYEGEHHTVWFHELDRLLIKYEYENYSVIAGRQAISWGSGRFWQPTDVFGAFSPTELNREYKHGIDGVKLDFFPTNESDLALAYVFGNRDKENFEDSAALHFRTTLGQNSEVTLLAGKIAGIITGGGSFETGWLGMGWRLESILFKQVGNGSNKHDNFSIAGVDYQFSDNLLIGLEYYYNSLGATSEDKLPQSARQTTFINGQQKHLSQNVFGIAFSKTLTPLLSGNYNFLASSLETPDDKTSWSAFHQLSFLYSLTNEADALLAMHYGTGKGLDTFGRPRSEFGHTPASLSLRLRAYF